MDSHSFYKITGIGLLIFSLLALGSIIYVITYMASALETIKSNLYKLPINLQSSLDNVSFGFDLYFFIFSFGGGWSFLIMLFSGIVYLLRGMRKSLTTKLIFSSAVIQIAAVLIILLGLLSMVHSMRGPSSNPFAVLAFLEIGLFTIFSTLISIIGAILLAIGLVQAKNQASAGN